MHANAPPLITPWGENLLGFNLGSVSLLSCTSVCPSSQSNWFPGIWNSPGQRGSYTRKPAMHVSQQPDFILLNCDFTAEGQTSDRSHSVAPDWPSWKCRRHLRFKVLEEFLGVLQDARTTHSSGRIGYVFLWLTVQPPPSVVMSQYTWKPAGWCTGNTEYMPSSRWPLAYRSPQSRGREPAGGHERRTQLNRQNTRWLRKGNTVQSQ